MDQQNNRLAGFNSDYLKYFMMVFCVAIIVFVLPKGRKFKYEFEKGKPWMHERLLAPFDFAIDKTPEEYEQEKNRVIAGMIPYYRVDMEQDSAIIHKFRKEFSGAWNSSYGAVESSRKIENEKTGLRLTRYVLDRGIIELNNEHKPYTPGKEIYVVNGKNATLSSFGSHLLLREAYKEIRRKIPQDHDLDTSIILLAIQNSLTPTIFYDQDLTSKATSEEIKKIALSKGMSKKDDVIIESGNIVDEGKFRVLESLKNEYDKRLGMLGNKWIVTLGQVLLIGLILALLMFFLSMFRKDIYADNRKMFIILLIVTTMLVVLSWALRMKIPSLYFIPYCIVPIIIRVIFDTRLALYIHLLVVIIAGFFVPNGYEFIFLQITAGMVAINSIKNLLRRSQFLASAILIYLTYVVGFIGISIIHEGSFLNIQWENVLWFMISVVLSLLAYPLIYAFEKLFGITTEVTLMEYTNVNTPLLRELSYKAPGTFQHSLQVANLAEAAVFEIGGNALLIRAGALYHDVGKIESPQYFIENQQKGINPHDQLSDEDSARVIIRHVYAGIELANKHRLPQEIIDFIRTHHGSTRVDFFYHSFIKNYPELSINEKMFRYPGPIPFSKETAILMLADSVEAASRSLKEPSAQSIDDLVERIIDYKVSQQQLIDSDITIKEIYRIKAIFKEMLKSIYHVRIEY